MNLYEELGLPVSASPEDIRKAHRTLSRLLHPDQQTDENLRQAAELQMRRVNVMIGILLDPNKRKKYDDSLRAPLAELPTIIPIVHRPAPRASFSLLDLIGIILAAVMVTLLVIWLFGGDFVHLRALNSDISTFIDPEVVEARRDAVRTAPVPVQKRSIEDVSRTEPRVDTTSLPLPEVHAVHLGMPIGPVRRTSPPMAVLQPDPSPISLNAYPPASMTLPIVPAPELVTPDKVPTPALSFAGLWLLPSSAKKAARSGSVQHAPQFIQVSISYADNDIVFGDYSARYEAPDRPVSPQVDFSFQGPVAGNAATIDWNTPDGSRGVVELKLLNSRAMQVTWHVSRFGNSIGIAGGAAVLVRKAD